VRIKVSYFGRFAAEIGKFSEEIDMNGNPKVKDLVTVLIEKYPFLKNEVIEVSINGKYAKEDDLIISEVSVFPIISGG
jgi:molybdopterin synthase sulfur carrier subunit